MVVKLQADRLKGLPDSVKVHQPAKLRIDLSTDDNLYSVAVSVQPPALVIRRDVG
jgi:hypothetical protein